MPSFRSFTPLFILLGCLLLAGSAVAAHSQTSQSSTFKFPPATGLAVSAGPNPAASTPPAIYDEQLGITFSQGSNAITCNVTALEQSDSDGYGPGYLLNGLTNNGYWYQVGVSFDWPYQTGSYVSGFALNYEVFSSNGVSVYPSEGGGIQSFSGTVSSGDNVALKLYFSGGDIIMSAIDMTSGATSSTSYNGEGATTFVGLSSPANSNGFFTGLMTEWYHASPYYSNEGQVTYSYPQAIPSAWMWMDEYNPSNLGWSGGFSTETEGPSTYTDAPNTLQSLTSHGASEASDAYEFVTGYEVTSATTTSITLTPSLGSDPLSSSNYFVISYTLGGEQETANSQGGTLVLNTDTNTNVIVSGTSTGSNSSEEWVLDSQAAQVSVASGATATFDYYDLIAQPLSYSISGGGNPATPMATYTTAPATASVESSPVVVETSLSLSQQTIWTTRASTVTVTNPIPGVSGERWFTQTSQWTSISPDFIPRPISYVHQYNVSIGFSVSSGSGYSPPSVSCTEFGNQVVASLGSSLWADAESSCSYTSVLMGSTQSERWAIPSSSFTVSAPGALSPTYYNQYALTITYTIDGGGSPSPPTITGTSFGTGSTVSLLSSIITEWLDAGSQYSLSNPLPSSTSSERWSCTTTTAGSLNAPGTLSATFYHQFLIYADFAIVGGQASLAPTLSYTSFGVQASETLASSPQSFWADSGSQYAAPTLLGGSGPSERWYSSAYSGSVEGSATLTFTYYHQFLLTITGAISSSRWYNASATITVSVQGVSNRTSGMGLRVESYSLDGGTAAVVQPTSGTIQITVLMNSGHQLSITSVKQYEVTLDAYTTEALASVTSPTIPGDAYWYDQGTTVTLVLNGVYGRASGVGTRLSSYSINGGAPTSAATTGMVTVLNALPMSSPLSIASTTVAQYQVSLDAGAAAALGSITPPTITGDNYWYDEGATVSLLLNGVWARSSGTGERLVSYSVDGASSSVATGKTVYALMLGTISTPEVVSAEVTTQYLLSTISGFIESATATPIQGDAGWYDTGTTVTLVCNYSWNSTSGQSRANAIGYTIGQGTPVPLNRAGNGTFDVQVAMTAPQTVTIESVQQYHLTVSGGYDVTLSNSSPTGDYFYDSGSTLTISTEYTWGVINGNTRQNLVSYSLDGLATNVTRAASGTFSTPTISFTGPRELNFVAVTQYLVSFQFKDGSLTHTIVPTSFQIQVTGTYVVYVNQSQIWLDSGANYKIFSVMWEGANVKPTEQSTYIVGGPTNITLADSVFDSSIAVTDYLGFPVSGAKLSATFANGTTIERSTPSNGTIKFGLIPLGPFSGSLSFLGTTIPINGNASTQPQMPVKIFASYPTIGVIVLVVAVVVVGALLTVRRQRPPKSQPIIERSSGKQSDLCAYHSSKLILYMIRSPKCG